MAVEGPREATLACVPSDESDETLLITYSRDALGHIETPAISEVGRDPCHSLHSHLSPQNTNRDKQDMTIHRYGTLTLVMDDDLLVAVVDSEQGQSGNTSHGWLETLPKVFIRLKYVISIFSRSDQFRGPCPGVSRTSSSPRLYPSLFHSCTGFLSARTAYRAIPAGS